MKNKKCIPIFILVTYVLLNSCGQDFVEIDLSKSTVTIQAPANNFVSTSYTQTFWWEEVKGATNYKLQIVKPNFTTVQQLVLDSTLTTNQFSYTLQPGNYQWRIKAMNSTSSTSFVTYDLTIDSSSTLSSAVVLISPLDNASKNNLTQSFSWYAMSNATNYIFQMYTSSGVPIGVAQSVTTNTVSCTFATEGTFKWRVFAQNASSTSNYAERTITIDTTKPTIPVPKLPLQNDTASNPVLISWTSDATSSNDSLYVYSDSTMLVIVKDTLTVSQQYYFRGTVSTNYYWRVKSEDAAGNWSAFTTRRKFKINP